MIDTKKILLRSLTPILACSMLGSIGFIASTAHAQAMSQTTTSTAKSRRAEKRAAKKAAKEKKKAEAAKKESTTKSAKSEKKAMTAEKESTRKSSRKVNEPSSTSTTRASEPKTSHRASPTTGGTANSGDIANAKAKGLVWVNTGTKVYHTGGRYYGTTKHGQFMTKSEAESRGYRESKK